MSSSGVYFTPWVIIQHDFILLLKLRQPWPPGSCFSGLLGSFVTPKSLSESVFIFVFELPSFWTHCIFPASVLE